MKLYNTLSKSLEEFSPIEDKKVSLYTCGPTVYSYAHIGNLRTYLFEDLLKRTLEYVGYDIKHVMNMTDVDDKTIKASEGKKAEFSKLTKKFEAAFLADLKKLNIEPATEITRATEYIEQIVAFVSDLLENGYAYKGEDGSIYFSIEKFKDYGKLSGLDKEGIKSGARVAQDEYAKENPADFALWKAWDEADGEIFWETELGKGRPGWHIECSAMSQDKLGATIDIHAGAVDLMFPHHENEIAQSEARTGKKFVNFWVHGEHLLVDGKKMSKSLNNMYRLKDIEEEGYSAIDFRYMVISSHYRDKLNFTWSSLKAKQNAVNRAKKIINALPNDGNISEEYITKFKSAIGNDLNTPDALAVFWNLLRDENVSAEDKKATALQMDKVFGLNLNVLDALVEPETLELQSDLLSPLIEKRKEAKENKDFELADQLRSEIEDLGYVLEDTKEGTKVYKK